MGTLGVVVALVFALKPGSAEPEKAVKPRASTTATVPPVTTFRLVAAEVPAASGAPLPDVVLSGVLATLNRYLDSAVVSPLRTGTVAADLASIFTPAAALRLTGPDRATLVDEGLPPAGRGLGVDDAAVTLTGLLDNDGSISVVAARVDLTVRTGSGPASTRVARSGELVLVPDVGSWKIDGYDLRVTREPLAPAPATTGAAQ